MQPDPMATCKARDQRQTEASAAGRRLAHVQPIAQDPVGGVQYRQRGPAS
jgi:hypothetical protein